MRRRPQAFEHLGPGTEHERRLVGGAPGARQPAEVAHPDSQRVLEWADVDAEQAGGEQERGPGTGGDAAEALGEVGEERENPIFCA